MCHSPVLIHAGRERWRTGRRGFEHSVELTNWGQTLGATWGRVLRSPVLDSCPESNTEPDTSASCPPPPETPSSVQLSSDLAIDSSTSTEVSSSSRSRLESALQTSKLVGNWGTMVETASDSESSELHLPTADNLEFFISCACSLALVLERVTLGVGGVDWRSADGMEGTNFTGNNILRCKVLERPLPSNWRTLKTGMAVSGWDVTTKTSSSQRSASFCFPFSPTFRTKTWSPGCKEAPRTFTSYHLFLFSPALFVLASTKSWACFIRFLRSAM